MLNNQGQAQEIEVLLNKVVRLLSVLVTQDKVQREQILILGAAGLSRNEIAEIVGTTPGTVSVELSKMKGRRKKPSKGLR